MVKEFVNRVGTENLAEKVTFKQRSKAGKEGAIAIPRRRVFQTRGSLPGVWRSQQGGLCTWRGMSKIPFFLPFEETATLCTLLYLDHVIGRIEEVLHAVVFFIC